jgi:hypothetical protein
MRIKDYLIAHSMIKHLQLTTGDPLEYSTIQSLTRITRNFYRIVVNRY